MKRKPRPRRLLRYILLGLFALLYFGPLAALVMFLVTFALAYLLIAVNVAGRVIGGLLSGYRLTFFRVGPLLVWQNEGLHCRRTSFAANGICSMVPPSPVDGRIPCRRHMLGGAVAQLSLIPGLIALGVWQFKVLLDSVEFQDATFTTHIAASGICFGVAGLCLIFALTQLIPKKKLANVGYIARLLRCEPMAVDVFCRLMMMNEATIRGQRLCEMPDAWFDLTSLEPTEPLAADLYACAIQRYVDAHRYDEAIALLDPLLDCNGLSNGTRNMMLCARITLALLEGTLGAVWVHDTPAMQQYLAAMRHHPTVLRTEYAVARLRDRDEKAAAKLAARWAKVAPRVLFSGELARERELMEMIDAANSRFMG